MQVKGAAELPPTNRKTFLDIALMLQGGKRIAEWLIGNHRQADKGLTSGMHREDRSRCSEGKNSAPPQTISAYRDQPAPCDLPRLSLDLTGGCPMMGGSPDGGLLDRFARSLR